MAITSLSQLSQLSVDTALSFEEFSSPSVKVLFSIDDVAIASGGIRAKHETFAYERLRFVVQSETFMNSTRLTLRVGSAVPAEWHLLYQLRTHTGDEAGERMKVVDKTVLEFVPGGKPLSVDVTDSAVRYVKFELRTINQLYLEHPSFSTGDITVKFADGRTVRTWKGLLALVSPYIAERLADPVVDCLDLGDFPINQFVELLMQLHPTRRPLYSDFEALSQVAVSFRVDTLVHQLSQHLVDFSHRPMSFEDKCQAALRYQLLPALVELVTKAVENGHWDRLIRDGFDPSSFFTAGVYKKVVCPTVLAARGLQMERPSMAMRTPWSRPDYFTPAPHTAALVFRGTRFYVNKGILAVHGLENFAVGPEGELVAKFSLEMQSCCAVSEIIPGKVLVSLLDFLYPGGPSVQSNYLRAAIILCRDFGWSIAKEDLEQRLLLEPATSKQLFLQQIRFAERFHLANMVRNCIFRAESSCQEFASELAKEDFPGVSEETKFQLMARLCSGWALQPEIVNNLGIRRGTSFREREVRLNKGGALGFEDHLQEGTLEGLNSEYAFGPVAELQAV